MDFSFYSHLLQFPLFQGLSKSEMLQLAGQTKFGFLKLNANQPVVKQDDVCRQLFFLIKGSLTMATSNDSSAYTVCEQLSAPWLLQPEALFGAQPRYFHNVSTATESHFITLSKDEVLELIDDFLIIRINLFNLLATQSQRRGHMPWRRCASDLRQRIIRFFLDHCIYPAGKKEFRILMNQLAQEVGDSRIDVSHVLNDMQSEGLLVLHRGRIEIPSLERLLM